MLGSGERDNLAPALLAIPAYEAAVVGVGIISACATEGLLDLAKGMFDK